MIVMSFHCVQRLAWQTVKSSLVSILELKEARYSSRIGYDRKLYVIKMFIFSIELYFGSHKMRQLVEMGHVSMHISDGDILRMERFQKTFLQILKRTQQKQISHAVIKYKVLQQKVI